MATKQTQNGQGYATKLWLFNAYKEAGYSDEEAYKWATYYSEKNALTRAQELAKSDKMKQTIGSGLKTIGTVGMAIGGLPLMLLNPLATIGGIAGGWGVDLGIKATTNYDGWGDMIASNTPIPKETAEIFNPGMITGGFAGSLGDRAAASTFGHSNLGRAWTISNMLNESTPLFNYRPSTPYTRVVQPNGKVKFRLPSHTDENPREFVLEPIGDNKYNMHMRIWNGLGEGRTAGSITPEERDLLLKAITEELPMGAELAFPTSGEGYLATRGTAAVALRFRNGIPETISGEYIFEPGTPGSFEYVADPKTGATKTVLGNGWIKTGDRSTRYQKAPEVQLDINDPDFDPIDFSLGALRRMQYFIDNDPYFRAYDTPRKYNGPYGSETIYGERIPNPWQLALSQDVVDRAANLGWDVDNTLVSLRGRDGYMTVRNAGNAMRENMLLPVEMITSDLMPIEIKGYHMTPTLRTVVRVRGSETGPSVLNTLIHENVMHGSDDALVAMGDTYIEDLDSMESILSLYNKLGSLVKKLENPKTTESSSWYEARATLGEARASMIKAIAKTKGKEFYLKAEITPELKTEFETAVDKMDHETLAQTLESVNSYGEDYALVLRDEASTGKTETLNLCKWLIKKAPMIVGGATTIGMGSLIVKNRFGGIFNKKK